MTESKYNTKMAEEFLSAEKRRSISIDEMPDLINSLIDLCLVRGKRIQELEHDATICDYADQAYAESRDQEAGE